MEDCFFLDIFGNVQCVMQIVNHEAGNRSELLIVKMEIIIPVGPHTSDNEME